MATKPDGDGVARRDGSARCDGDRPHGAGKKMTKAEKKKHDAMVKKDAMAHDAMKTSTPK